MGSIGDPLLNQPPTTVNINDVTQQEIDPRNRAKLESLGRKDSGEHNTFWGSFWASIRDGALTLVKDFAGTTDKILAIMGDFFHAAQGEGTTGFYDLSATILGDLTGVEVDKQSLQSAAFGSGRLAAMKVFGADLYNMLEDEFKPDSGDLETGDAGPAEKFLGFLMNFSIRQGNIELLTSMIPEEYRFAEGFRAYGELMGKNLGLGRLARQALKPLITTLVADPLQYKLNEDYRPKRIGATPAIKKFFRDPDFEDAMRKELAQEGYSDSRINDLIDELRPLLSTSDLINFALQNDPSSLTSASPETTELGKQLAQRGYTPNDIVRLIAVQRPTLAKGEIATLFAGGIIQHDIASGFLSKLGYDSDTAELVLQAHSLTHHHGKVLGLAELKRAFHNAVIDLLELKAKLSAQGYSDDDIQIITLDLLQPTHGKVRQLSLAEVKAGFKAGVLTEQQATDHLKLLGYADADVAVLVKSLPGPKAPATPATPSS